MLKTLYFKREITTNWYNRPRVWERATRREYIKMSDEQFTEEEFDGYLLKAIDSLRSEDLHNQANAVLMCKHRMEQFKQDSRGPKIRDETDDFERLRKANLERVHYFGHGDIHEGWNIAEWGCALGGECGELLNILKKINRHASFDPHYEVLRVAAGKELADVLIYADLIAAKLDLDLFGQVVFKFNETSEAYGFETKI